MRKKHQQYDNLKKPHINKETAPCTKVQRTDGASLPSYEVIRGRCFSRAPAARKERKKSERNFRQPGKDERNLKEILARKGGNSSESNFRPKKKKKKKNTEKKSAKEEKNRTERV